MKQLLLITAISCFCATQAFAGSSCKTCPSQAAQEKPDSAEQPKKDAESDAVKSLLCANESTTTTTTTTTPAPADETKPATPDAAPADGQMQTKFLLASDTSSCTADACKKPAAAADEKKSDAEVEAEKQAPAQLIA